MEIWKDIPGYEGLYQVSDKGRVKSMKRIIKWGKCIKKERILKNNINTNGYYHVSFNLNSLRKNYLVHRLQAICFIENESKLPYVNHKDGDKRNNCIENLEWCTQKENVRHAWENGLNKISQNNSFIKNHPHKGLLGKNHFNSKKVLQFDKDGNFIRKWDSMADVNRNLKIRQAVICGCCRGKQRTAGGFIWKYYNYEI